VSQSSEFCHYNPLCCFLTSACCCFVVYFVIDSVQKLLVTPLCYLIDASSAGNKTGYIDASQPATDIDYIDASHPTILFHYTDACQLACSNSCTAYKPAHNAVWIRTSDRANNAGHGDGLAWQQ